MSDEPRDLDLPILHELGDSLKAGFRRREARDFGQALKRRRMFLLVPVAALVAAGGALAAVAALRGTPSAPLTGPVAAPNPTPGYGTSRYSVTLSPSLAAGTVGWCIDAEVQVPVPVAVNNVHALRAFLLGQREQLLQFRAAAIASLAGHTGTITTPGGQAVPFPAVPASQRARLEQGLRTNDRHLSEIPKLLRDLAHRNARASLAFQNAIRNLAGQGYEYKAPGQDCGHVATAHRPFVGNPYIGFTGSEYSIPNSIGARPFGPDTPPHALGATTLTTTAVYLTAPDVAAVRTARGETILTKSAGLPNRYRIAVTVKATVQNPTSGRLPLEPNRIYSAQQPPQHAANRKLPSTANLPAPAALNENGQQLTSPTAAITASTPSIAWKPAQQFVPKYANGGNVLQLPPGAHPPSGACEIDTSSVPGAHFNWGAVVPHLRPFPQLTGETLMSCAYLSFYLPDGAAPQAAILLDAQHPNTAPPPLPGAQQISQHPDIVNEPIVQLSGTTDLTARRIGNAWLAIDGAGSTAHQIEILNQLHICVHLRGPLCHPTQTIPNLDTTPQTTTTTTS